MARSRNPRSDSFRVRANYHDQMADLSLADADPGAAAERHAEADRLNAEANREVNDRNPTVRARAHQKLAQATRVRHVATATAADANHHEHIKHRLVAAQLRAMAEGADPATAASDVMRMLLVDPVIGDAAKAHPYAVLVQDTGSETTPRRRRASEEAPASA